MFNAARGAGRPAAPPIESTMPTGRLARLLTLLVLPFLLTGCPETPPDAGPPAETPDGGETADAAGAAGAAEEPEDLPTRTSTDGLWRMTMFDQGMQVPFLLLRVDGSEVEVVEKREGLDELELQSAGADGETVRATFKITPPPEAVEAAGGEVDPDDPRFTQTMDLRLKDGLLLGTIDIGGVGRPFTIGTATEKGKLPDVQPRPSESAIEIETRFRDLEDGDLSRVRKYLAGLGHDPTKYLGLLRLMQIYMQMPAGPEEMEEDARALAESASDWGGELEKQAAMQSLIAFATREEVPADMARRQLERTREVVGEGEGDVATMLRVAEAFIDVRDEAAEEAAVAEAVAALEEELPPTDMVMELKVREARRRGDEEAELRATAELTVAPNGVEKMNRVGELYVKTRGGAEGIGDYVTGVYRDVTTGFLADADVPEVGRPVLLEMFTGQSCGPCVAADLALSAMSEAVPEAVVIRYHVDVPGPDPLTTAAGRERFRVYKARGAPTVVVDGLVVEGVGGPFVEAATSFERLAGVLQTREDREATPIELSAERDGTKLSLAASAEGLAAEADVRLLVAIATDELFFKADNGVLMHEMIVRDMPTGPDGVPAEGGKVELEQTVDLIDSRNQLIAGMQVPFEQLPEGMRDSLVNYADLTVVAFLQDFKTKEVLGLETVSVPAPKADTPAESGGDESAEKADTPVEEVQTDGGDSAEDAEPAGDE